ncbi:hypothetical protein PAPYR_12932 [Paratrimastix pyriformis]|uniref:Uncharacterized protein n=1 Tax=Paratrimastix pyriformis TaxID=342808 RepID=A0ABQ8U3B2_9EUKA|nr:hypothetical protein PAPYR_12932 [Paratrimastix pyriformis]
MDQLQFFSASASRRQPSSLRGSAKNVLTHFMQASNFSDQAASGSFKGSTNMVRTRSTARHTSPAFQLLAMRCQGHVEAFTEQQGLIVQAAAHRAALEAAAQPQPDLPQAHHASAHPVCTPPLLLGWLPRGIGGGRRRSGRAVFRELQEAWDCIQSSERSKARTQAASRGLRPAQLAARDAVAGSLPTQGLSIHRILFSTSGILHHDNSHRPRSITSTYNSVLPEIRPPELECPRFKHRNLPNHCVDLFHCDRLADNIQPAPDSISPLSILIHIPGAPLYQHHGILRLCLGTTHPQLHLPLLYKFQIPAFTSVSATTGFSDPFFASLSAIPFPIASQFFGYCLFRTPPSPSLARSRVSIRPTPSDKVNSGFNRRLPSWQTFLLSILNHGEY